MKSTQSSTKNFKWARGTVLALAALCLGTSLASAQDLQGKFTLPFEARWGQATLPPGEYTFTVSEATVSFANMITVRRGNRAVAMVLPLQVADCDSWGSSQLTAVRISAGAYRIRDLKLGPLGQTFSFSMPKSERQVIARGPDSVRVLVIRGGK